jgi:putative hemin transport protein
MNHRYQTYLQLKALHPHKYARDVARLMNISEAELTHARVGAEARRLRLDVPAMLAALEAVDETKSITRNEYAVHEQIGRYQHWRIGEHGGLVLNPRGLDLRLFPAQWASAFFVNEQTARGERQSIQFYDGHGDAVLKVYATAQTRMADWDRCIGRFSSADNPPLVLAPPPAANEQAEAPPQLEREWREMTDVHQFFNLLKRHNLTRQQAFRAVSEDLACRVDNQALREILEAARQDGNEIMIFVGNRGCVQIFTGVIEKVTPWQNWINVFNTEFTLHLMEDRIAESWVTRKPTGGGVVTSLELFAADGTQIAQLFGQRSEGQPEQTRWRSQIGLLTTRGAAA